MVRRELELSSVAKTKKKSINKGMGLPNVFKKEIDKIVTDFFFYGILRTFERTVNFSSNISFKEHINNTYEMFS